MLSLRVSTGRAADPPLMKLGGVPDGFICAVGTEVGFCLVRWSPVASLTRGASMTPTGATGGNAPEHAC